MIQQREFVRKVGEESVYRFKDKRFGYRYVVSNGVRERLFDNEAEVQAFFDRSTPITLNER